MKLSKSIFADLKAYGVSVRGSVTWEYDVYFDTWGQRYNVLKRNGKIIDYYFNINGDGSYDKNAY